MKRNFTLLAAFFFLIGHYASAQSILEKEDLEAWLQMWDPGEYNAEEIWDQLMQWDAKPSIKKALEFPLWTAEEREILEKECAHIPFFHPAILNTLPRIPIWKGQIMRILLGPLENNQTALRGSTLTRIDFVQDGIRQRNTARFRWSKWRLQVTQETDPGESLFLDHMSATLVYTSAYSQVLIGDFTLLQGKGLLLGQGFQLPPLESLGGMKPKVSPVSGSQEQQGIRGIFCQKQTKHGDISLMLGQKQRSALWENQNIRFDESGNHHTTTGAKRRNNTTHQLVGTSWIFSPFSKHDISINGLFQRAKEHHNTGMSTSSTQAMINHRFRAKRGVWYQEHTVQHKQKQANSYIRYHRGLGERWFVQYAFLRETYTPMQRHFQGFTTALETSHSLVLSKRRKYASQQWRFRTILKKETNERESRVEYWKSFLPTSGAGYAFYARSSQNRTDRLNLLLRLRLQAQDVSYSLRGEVQTLLRNGTQSVGLQWTYKTQWKAIQIHLGQVWTIGKAGILYFYLPNVFPSGFTRGFGAGSRMTFIQLGKAFSRLNIQTQINLDFSTSFRSQYPIYLSVRYRI